MNAPSIDMKNYLVTNGVGTFGQNPTASGWSIFIGKEPDRPDNTVTLYDTPGDAPNPKWLLDFPRFQIRVRNNKYELAYNKAEEVKSWLLGLPSQDLGGIRYVGIYVVIDTHFLQTDESARSIFVSTWRIIREPAAGQHRRPL
jgi:hypothetical protein